MPKCYESTVFSLGIKEVGLYLNELEFASRKDAVIHCAKSFFSNYLSGYGKTKRILKDLLYFRYLLLKENTWFSFT